MSYSYNTTTKKVTVTSTSTARALHDDIQTTFTGSTYMQYLIPDAGSIKDALYLLKNGWTFLDVTSIGFMTTGGWQSDDGDDKWTNVKCISGDTFTGIQLYCDQGSGPVDFGATGLVNALLKVRDGGADTNSQNYTVYSRPFQKRFSQFSVTAAAGGIDTVPLSVSDDPYLTIAALTLDGYTDLSIAWATIYRSAFNGASTTKYTLDGTLAIDATTVTVNEALDAGVPSSGTLAIGTSVNQEVITYTGKGTYTFTGCTRAAHRTTAAEWAGSTALSTNTKQYTIQVKTTSGSRTLVQIYNWIQYMLTSGSDIDLLTGGHIGKTTAYLVAYAGTMTTAQGVWVEGFSSADANSIAYTDQTGSAQSPPLTVAVVVNYDAAVTSGGGQVYVAELDGTYTDATYTPTAIVRDLINAAASGTSKSTSITYTTDVPVRVIVRCPGLQQFSLYTSITSSGLNVTAQTPVDAAY